MSATADQKQLAYNILIGMLQNVNSEEQDAMILKFIQDEGLMPNIDKEFNNLTNYLDGRK